MVLACPKINYQRCFLKDSTVFLPFQASGMADTANRHKHTRTARATRRVMVGAIFLVVESTTGVGNFYVQISGLNKTCLNKLLGCSTCVKEVLTTCGKNHHCDKEPKLQAFSSVVSKNSLESKACWTELLPGKLTFFP